MERIDAHCHFWELARGDYGWLKPDDAALAPIYRDFDPTDMEVLRRAADISGIVAVQAAPSEDETRYLLSLASRHPEILGVVGWIDLTADDAATRLAMLAGNPLFKGVRPMLQDLPDDDWINTGPTSQALDALESHGLRFDALVLPRHLVPLESFVLSRPSLPVVIDHAAKPALAATEDDLRHRQWREGMERLAALPHIHCKLSGLLTEMRPDQMDSVSKALTVLEPIVGHLLEWFGPQRLIWGSDWPVLTLAASHNVWIEVTERLLSGLNDTDRKAILGGNAVRFYGLEGRAA